MVAAISDKKSIENRTDESKGTALIQHEPIHFHILPLNEPIPATCTGVQEKQNIELTPFTSATTKQLVTSERSKKDAAKTALN